MRALVFLAALTACNNPIGVDDLPFDAGPSVDATVSDAPIFPFDAQNDAPKFNGGGDFLCNGCVCDGTLRFCEESSAGKAPILDAGDDVTDAADETDGGDAAFEDASACDLDAGANACFAIPIDCLPKPTCACLLTHVAPECTCSVDPSGSGLVVACIFP